MKSKSIPTVAPARAIAPSAPAVADASLAPVAVVPAPSATADADSIGDATLVVLTALRAKQKPAREAILSRWGDYAKSGLVATTDRGTLLDGKKVGDLLKAASKAEDRKLEAICSAFILRHNAIDKLVKAVEGGAF